MAEKVIRNTENPSEYSIQNNWCRDRKSLLGMHWTLILVTISSEVHEIHMQYAQMVHFSSEGLSCLIFQREESMEGATMIASGRVVVVDTVTMHNLKTLENFIQ